MSIDNIEFVKNNILDFKSNDIYYVIKLIGRKKDCPNDEIDVYHKFYGNNNERLIISNTVTNLEEFDNKVEFLKQLCFKLPYTRLYIEANGRSVKKTLCNVTDIVNDIAKNYINGNTSPTLTRLNSLINTVRSISKSNSRETHQYIVLDIDYDKSETSNEITINKQVEEFKSNLKKSQALFYTYKTVNGLHIILLKSSHGSLSKQFKLVWYLNFINRDYVDVKDNAALLLYYNK